MFETLNLRQRWRRRHAMVALWARGGGNGHDIEGMRWQHYKLLVVENDHNIIGSPRLVWCRDSRWRRKAWGGKEKEWSKRRYIRRQWQHWIEPWGEKTITVLSLMNEIESEVWAKKSFLPSIVYKRNKITKLCFHTTLLPTT